MKSDQGYAQVQYRISELRRSGRLPYGWISDATRRGYYTPTYDNAADFLRSMHGLYRAHLWRDTPYHVEVWVESRSLAGVVQDDCEELAVSLYPAAGFSSMTLIYEAAKEVIERYDGVTWIIFYIGDFDPAGVLIDRSIEKELRHHLAESDKDMIKLFFYRIGVTEEQVNLYGLPTKPRKEKDKRAKHITYTVEAEAMPAHIMRSILRREIEALLPAGALAAAKAAEESERAAINIAAMAMERGA